MHFCRCTVGPSWGLREGKYNRSPWKEPVSKRGWSSHWKTRFKHKAPAQTIWRLELCGVSKKLWIYGFKELATSREFLLRRTSDYKWPWRDDVEPWRSGKSRKTSTRRQWAPLRRQQGQQAARPRARPAAIGHYCSFPVALSTMTL